MLADDGVGSGGPAEGLRICVVGVELGPDRLMQFDNGAEDTTFQAPLRQCGEQAFDSVVQDALAGVQ